MADATRTCATCDETLPPRKRRYCSDKCRIANRNARMLARHHELKADPEYLERRRATAKRSYQKMRLDPEALALQMQRTADWRSRNAEAMARSNREWQLANADRVRAKIQRRRARLLAAFVEDVDPRVVFIRDAGLCGICGDTVDPLIPWPHKMSKTLDHIIALSRDGTHEYANIQLAHAVCNSRKNDRLDDVTHGVSLGFPDG